jgi:hypothetical protein
METKDLSLGGVLILHTERMRRRYSSCASGVWDCLLRERAVSWMLVFWCKDGGGLQLGLNLSGRDDGWSSVEESLDCERGTFMKWVFRSQDFSARSGSADGGSCAWSGGRVPICNERDLSSSEDQSFGLSVSAHLPACLTRAVDA